MPNLYTEFKRLVPDAPLLVGTITAVDAGGVTVELPDGATLRVRGEGAVDDVVFVRNGLIEGPAPTLAVVEIEI
jgi:hypothetical protein